MNKDEEIKQVILNLLKAVDKGVQFTSEQMPLVLEEVLRYNLMISWFYLGLWLFLLSFTIYLSNIFYRKSTDSERFLIVFLIAFIPTLSSTIGIMDSIEKILKITTAPRVFLLEYLKHLT